MNNNLMNNKLINNKLINKINSKVFYIVLEDYQILDKHAILIHFFSYFHKWI
jgi:hypothetical protein